MGSEDASLHDVDWHKCPVFKSIVLTQVSHAAINLLRDIDRFVADIFSTPSTKPTNFFYCFVSL